MNRITEKDLGCVVERINRMTDNALEPYTKTEDGQYKANIGNYHLSHAYGGVSLHRMLTDGGGIEDVFRCGHVPKRELYNRMHRFIAGLDYASL